MCWGYVKALLMNLGKWSICNLSLALYCSLTFWLAIFSYLSCELESVLYQVNCVLVWTTCHLPNILHWFVPVFIDVVFTRIGEKSVDVEKYIYFPGMCRYLHPRVVPPSIPSGLPLDVIKWVSNESGVKEGENELAEGKRNVEVANGRKF